MTEYNGYTNYETWNVALWIGNDEGFYHLALDCENYQDFVSQIKEIFDDKNPKHYQTPDNVSWTDSGLNIKELDDVIKELKD